MSTLTPALFKGNLYIHFGKNVFHEFRLFSNWIFAFLLLCSGSSLHIPVSSCQICGWYVFCPSLYLIFSSFLIGFLAEQKF